MCRYQLLKKALFRVGCWYLAAGANDIMAWIRSCQNSCSRWLSWRTCWRQIHVQYRQTTTTNMSDSTHFCVTVCPQISPQIRSFERGIKSGNATALSRFVFGSLSCKSQPNYLTNWLTVESVRLMAALTCGALIAQLSVDCATAPQVCIPTQSHQSGSGKVRSLKPATHTPHSLKTNSKQSHNQTRMHAHTHTHTHAHAHTLKHAHTPLCWTPVNINVGSTHVFPVIMNGVCVEAGCYAQGESWASYTLHKLLLLATWHTVSKGNCTKSPLFVYHWRYIALALG